MSTMMMSDNFVDNEGQSVDLYTIRSWQKDRLVACGISPPVEEDSQQQRDQPPSLPGSMRLPSHYYSQKQLRQQQQQQQQQQQRYQQLPRFVPRTRSPTSVAAAPYDEFSIRKKKKASSTSGRHPSISDQIDDGTFDDTIPTMVTTSTATTENHENNVNLNHSMMDDDVDDDDDEYFDDIFSFKSRPSHEVEAKEEEGEEEVEYDIHDRPTNREFTGATIVCALAGLLVGGPLGACAGAASSAYVVSTPTKAGKLARKGGESVVAVSEKVGDTVMSTPLARKSVERSEKAVSQARVHFENSKVVQRLKELDEKHQWRQRALCGCTSDEGGNTFGMVQPQQLHANKSSNSNSFCLQKCVDDILDDEDETDDSDDDVRYHRTSQPPRASVVSI